jgi:hypothetical protein
LIGGWHDPATRRDVRRVLGIVFAVLALARCAGGERSVGDASGITIDSVPVVSIGEEEGEEPYLFDDVADGIIVGDGRIVVADGGSGELRVFDSAGTYLTALGRRGAGPMEFDPSSRPRFHTSASTLLVTDQSAFRFHVLGADLQFRETRRFTLYPEMPRPYMQGVADNGDLLVQVFANGGAIRGAPGEVFNTTFHLLRYDSVGAMRDTILSLPMRPRLFHEHQGLVRAISLPLWAEPLFAIDGDRVIVVAGNAPALELHALDGGLLSQVVWDRTQVRASDLWDEYKRQSAVAMTGQRDSARYADFHGKALPLPEYAPLYSSVKVDPAGRIWLERFRMPLDSTRSWDVLDRDGKLLGSAESPRGVTVLRFTGDKMLGRHRDSLGVERVQLFRVRSGSR